MARRLIFKDDFLSQSPNPSSGYKIIGYNNQVISERLPNGQIVPIGGSGGTGSLVYYTEDTTQKTAQVYVPGTSSIAFTQYDTWNEKRIIHTYDGLSGDKTTISLFEKQIIAKSSTTGYDTARLDLKNNTGDGYVKLQSYNTNYLSTLTMDLNVSVNSTDLVHKNVGNNNRGTLHLSQDNAYISVNTGGTTSIVNVGTDFIEMTCDSDSVTRFGLYLNGNNLRLNIQGLPATASVPGDVWRDANGFLRIV